MLGKAAGHSLRVLQCIGGLPGALQISNRLMGVTRMIAGLAW